MTKKTKKNITEEELIANKALFTQRLIAYLLDMVLVTMVVSILSSPFIDMKTVSKLDKESTKIVENYNKKKINLENYFYQMSDINYQLSKVTGTSSLITMTVVILYFIVFQFYNKGQTIGKKIMNIGIVKYDRTTLTINDLIFRSLIINSILINMLNFALMLFVNKNFYGYTTIFLESIQYIILLTIFFMVIFRKDGRGLHDIIANTIVVKKDILKEEECKA